MIKIITKKSFLACFSLSLLTGCSSSMLSIPAVNAETPSLSISNLSPIFRCVANKINRGKKNLGFYHPSKNPKGLKKILVALDSDLDFFDGTIRKRSLDNSALVDSNVIIIKAIMSQWIDPDIVTLPLRDILGLKSDASLASGRGVGSILNNLGIPGKGPKGYPDPYTVLLSRYNVHTAYYLTGAFTKFDSRSPVANDGSAGRASSSGSTAGVLNYGSSKKASVMGLTASYGHISQNRILGSTMIEAKIRRDSQQLDFVVSPGEVSMGVSKKIVIAEGEHGTQHLLLESAALWFLLDVYKNQLDFNSCFVDKHYTPGKTFNNNKAMRDKAVVISRIQKNLQDKGFMQSSYTVGELDKPTMEAMSLS